MRASELLDPAHDGFGAGGVKALERSHRREHDRQAELASELAHRRVDLADVAQHARAKGDRVERHAVAPQRGLGFRPADDVIPVVLVEVLPRLGDEFMEVVKIAGCRRGVVDRSGLVGAILHDEPIGLEKGGTSHHDAHPGDPSSTSRARPLPLAPRFRTR